MANLFWKTGKKTKILLATPFKTEEEFEKIIYETPEILKDVYFIRRQIRGGNKDEIPDIIGIDNDGNICIVEMKNVAVDASIIPQVLKYAVWADRNPDSIKALWLECEDKPEDISISWEDLQVRIIVIAPEILPSTMNYVNRINYPIDLIEVKRWVEGQHHLLLVNKLEEEKKRKGSIAKGLEKYDKEFYMKNYNRKSVGKFLEYIREVEKIIKNNGWQLETKYNKHYCGFKAGFFNAFGIQWIGTKTFAFFFKLSENEAKRCPVRMTKYESLWNQAAYYIEPEKTKTKDFLPLFRAAYKKLTG
jgi:hypothetical protein